MTAVLVHSIEHADFGDDERTGWYIMRHTVVVRDGKPDERIDKTPVAKLVGDFGAEITSHALTLDHAAKEGDLIFMQRDWKFDDLAALLAKRKD